MNLSEAPPNTARITCLQCVTYAQIKRVVMWLSLSNNVETVTAETMSETQEKPCMMYSSKILKVRYNSIGL